MGKFNDVGGMISTNGCMEEVVGHRVLEGRKVWGTMAKLGKEHDIQRSKTGVIWKSSDPNRGLWFVDAVIKCTGEYAIIRGVRV